jgi:hypothetical protein
MPRDLYQSSSGDRWVLEMEGGSASPVIAHYPNASSGGRATRLGIGAFLAAPHHGPEHETLLRLIGSLAEENPRASATEAGATIAGEALNASNDE